MKKFYFLAWAAIIWHIDVDTCTFRAEEAASAVVAVRLWMAKKSI
ncbi:MAG: hypothetical protein ACYS3N_20805 [Planctomycetota bacterium]